MSTKAGGRQDGQKSELTPRQALADLRKQANAVRRALDKVIEAGALERLPENFDVAAFLEQVLILTATSKRRGRPHKRLTLREWYQKAAARRSLADPKAERAALLYLWHESKARNPDKKLTQTKFVETLVAFQLEKSQARPVTSGQRNSAEFRAQIRHFMNELSKAKRESAKPA